MTFKAATLILMAFVMVSPAYPQAQRTNQQKKDDDLPDVSLQIPEETRPEVRALLKANAKALSSKKVSDRERITAIQVLSELGEKAKPVRGLLCAALLDRNKNVRVAAADALKNIDPKIQYLAVKYVMEPERRLDLLLKIQELKEDGEPLTPLVTHSAKLSTQKIGTGDLLVEVTTLSYIAKNDLATYKLIATALDNPNFRVRHSAILAMTRMKHGRQSIPKMVKLLKADIPENQIAVIEALTALVDPSTEEEITEAIKAQRYHELEIVRNAVEIALNKLQNKKNPQDGRQP